MPWYKGNIHAHTSNSDGDASPERVIRWYHDHGYHFLVVSDHNYFTHQGILPELKGLRNDFLVVPGEELTGAKNIHFVCFNSRIPSDIFAVDRTLPVDALVREYASCAARTHGIPVFCHPNWRFSVTANDIYQAPEVRLFEIYNGSEDDSYNYGFTPMPEEAVKGPLPSLDEMWDMLLTRGKRIYGVAADDSHHYDKKGPKSCSPGRGFIVIHAESLTPADLGRSLLAGDFYASSGVVLSELQTSGDIIKIAIDAEATQANLNIESHHGNDRTPGKAGFRIEFIGESGRMLKQTEGLRAEIASQECGRYVRARAAYSMLTDERLREYYAWSQPVFLA
jgi:hypothetical protein